MATPLLYVRNNWERIDAVVASARVDVKDVRDALSKLDAMVPKIEELTKLSALCTTPAVNPDVLSDMALMLLTVPPAKATKELYVHICPEDAATVAALPSGRSPNDVLPVTPDILRSR